MQAAAEAALSQPPLLEPPAANAPQLQGTAGFAQLDALELESLALNLDTSLRVHATHHFFSWTQGSLQNLVRHELLICALRKSEPAALHFESFTTAPFELARFNEMLRQDSALVPHVVKTWEENHRRPVFCDTREGSQLAASALARELNRIEATTLIGHGTYDAYAKLASFFI